MQVLGDGARLLQEENGILLPHRVHVRSIDEGEELGQEGQVALDVLDDLDLVVEDEGVQHAKCRIVKYSSKYHVFEVLQSVHQVYPFPNALIWYLHHLFEL